MITKPLAKNLALLILVALVTIAVAETLVRVVLHITPGMRYSSQWFNTVDSVYSLTGMYADSLGIFRVEQVAADSIRKRIARFEIDKNENNLASKENEVAEVYSIASDYAKLATEQNELGAYLTTLKRKTATSLNDFEQEVIRYSQSPINADGFKSIEMKPFNATRKKVLLLGDSFTWGHSTSNKTNSFADILLSRGYAVYNTGLSGSDPAQYEAVARYYISKLQPDVVIVSFFMGNDVMWFNRKPASGIPIHYNTNAGNLLSCPNGIYFTDAKAAYNFAERNMRIPNPNFFVKHTALATLAWRVGMKYNLVNNIHEEDKMYWEKANSLAESEPASNVNLRAIQQMADSAGAECIIIAIPDFLSTVNSDPKNVPGLFEGVKWILSPVKKEEYRLEDGHFNNKGHLTYANFLERQIGLTAK